MTPDPFTRAYARLLEVLDEDADFTANVIIGNRPAGDAAGATRQRAHLRSALPHDRDKLGLVYVLPAPGGQFPLKGSTSSYQWVQRYSFTLSTDSIGFTDRLFPLKYIIIRALERARKKYTQTLGEDGFILDVQPVDVTESNQPSDLNNTTEKWWGIIGINVLMQLSPGELS